VPRAGGGAHPPEGEYLFVVMALVRVDAASEVKSAMEFLAEAVGEACGEAARGRGRAEAGESRGAVEFGFKGASSPSHAATAFLRTTAHARAR